MRFAHLSDFHYTTTECDYPVLRSGLVAALTLVVNDIAKISQHLDFVSITGDLTEAGDAESYTALGKLLSGLDIPVLVVPGNHDLRAPFQRVYSSDYHQPDRGTLDYRAVFEGVQVLGLDTLVEGEVGGCVSREQLVWLQICCLTGVMAIL